MHAYMNERHCRSFAEAVTSVGGTVPAEMTRLLAAMDAVKEWSPDTSADVTTRIRKGEFNAKNAAELLNAARVAPTTNPAEIRIAASKELVRAFDKAVNNGDADAIIDSVRPAFETAVAGVYAAAEFVTPDTQPSQVIDLGDKAVAAWRELPKHCRVLDTIDDRIISALVDSGSFNAIGGLPWMHPHEGGVLRALFYIRDENVDVLNAGRFMSAPNGTQRGGRWHRLVTATTLQLNNLTRAKELCTLYTAAEAERQARDYASTHPEYVRG